MALILLAAPAPAAEGEAAEAETPEAVPGEPEATRSPPPAADTARQAHLDALFDQLSAPDNPNWQHVQTQIWSAWRDSGSPSMNLLLNRASRAMEAQDYAKALAFLDDLVRLAPDFAEGWNMRATVHFLMGSYGPSVADIERTLALEPRHFGAMAGLGIILDRTGNEAGALRIYRQVIELHPNMEGAREGIDRLAPKIDGRGI